MTNVRSIHLAEAAVKVAKANHYMVHLVVPKDTTLEEFYDARQLLIDWEARGKVSPSEDTVDLAFELVESACNEIYGRGSF